MNEICNLSNCLRIYKSKNIISFWQHFLFVHPNNMGGSGWVKSDLDPTSNIFQKELSETFFASIISEEGEIIGFEKPGEHWVYQSAYVSSMWPHQTYA